MEGATWEIRREKTLGPVLVVHPKYSDKELVSRIPEDLAMILEGIRNAELFRKTMVPCPECKRLKAALEKEYQRESHDYDKAWRGKPTKGK